jgi:succinyl-CoA synthetase alpha subunit
MAILIDQTKRVLIQGITGREGTTRAKLMIDYTPAATQVVAGCTPGKGGEAVHGVPVFDTVAEAQEAVGQIDISVIFVPAPLVKDAALEAIAAGIKLLVLIPDRVPLYDVLEIVRAAEKNDARFVGPNTVGVLSPGKGVLGMVGGRAELARAWFHPGPVGIVSRSGGMSASTAYYLGKLGIGASTIVHVGGDAVVGLSLPDVIELFQADEETEAVVMFGEIGTSQEERVADLIEQGRFTKPLIAYIGGQAAQAGTRFSHAGAIVEGGRGTYEGKVKRLRQVGAHIVESFNDVPQVTKQVMGRNIVDRDW